MSTKIYCITEQQLLDAFAKALNLDPKDPNAATGWSTGIDIRDALFGSTRNSNVGTIHPEKTMFLRSTVGMAEDEKTGVKLEMSTNSYDNSPLIYSGKSKRYFSLNWQEICAMAEMAGVDTVAAPEKKTAPKKTKTKKEARPRA